MVFSRLFFIYLFFPICFLCYFATKKTSYRNAVLIVFSLLFYACGDISFLWLVVASALVNFVLGRGIDKFRDKAPAKAFLALGLVLNLGTLVGFKYTGFFIENLNNWFSLSIPVPDLPLPLGISFSRSARFPISSTVRGAKSRRNEISSRSCCTFPFPDHHFRTDRTVRNHAGRPAPAAGVCRRP